MTGTPPAVSCGLFPEKHDHRRCRRCGSAFFTAAVRAGATVIPYGDGPFRRGATAAREGVDAFPVDVEVDLVRQGLPGFTLVGLAEAAVREARERVFSALRACGFRLPPSRITVNLAPAGRRKSGTAFDLPILLSILAAAGEMAASPDDIYSMLNDADLKFPDAVAGDGEKHPVTHGTYIPLMQSYDRVLRKSAFDSLYSVYGQFRNTSAATLSAQLKQLLFFANVRKYPSTLDAALDGNEVPTEIYRNLIDAAHRSFAPMHRYVALRKKLLGVDELHMYDLYVPVVDGVEMKFTFEEAKEIALKALAPLGEDYLNLLREGFANGWIDVYENEGKRSGAYSAGARVHPYVLLNFKGTLDDVFTLVHEMGHSIHSYLSNKTQPTAYQDYVIFVAEVASTCNEALLMEYLLQQTDDKRRRAWLINHFLEQFKGTLYRQTMFAEFELRMGELNTQGETLTEELLCREYKALNEAYFGPDMVSDPQIALEWSRIPHFYYNYYVFQYATGYSAAIALARIEISVSESASRLYTQEARLFPTLAP